MNKRVLLKKMLSAGMSAVLTASLFVGLTTTASANQRYRSSDVRTVLCSIADGTTNPAQWDLDGNGVVDTQDARALLGQVIDFTIDYTDVQKTDFFGDRSITILGDSMCQGSNTGDIPNNSWVGLVKKAVNAKTGDNNYGFTSVEGTLWSTNISNDIHSFPDASSGYRDRNDNSAEKAHCWAEYRSGELLGTKGLGNSYDGEWLDFFPKTSYRYFCIYYQAGPAQGKFTVSTDSGNTLLADVNGKTEVDCTAAEAGGLRTAFYDMSKLVNQNIRLTVKGSGKNVTFTGIGYYNDPNGVVVTNYSNGGLQFAGTGTAWNGDITGLEKQYIIRGAQAETLIFSLGYNDSHFDNDKNLFLEKLDLLISECKKNNTNVIVNDTLWYIPTQVPGGGYMNQANILWYKNQLKRLALETNGKYIDQQALSGDQIFQYVSDGAHPTAEGHKIMAANIIHALELD